MQPLGALPDKEDFGAHSHKVNALLLRKGKRPQFLHRVGSLRRVRLHLL